MDDNFKTILTVACINLLIALALISTLQGAMNNSRGIEECSFSSPITKHNPFYKFGCFLTKDN